jgi:hypothetical protein
MQPLKDIHEHREHHRVEKLNQIISSFDEIRSGLGDSNEFLDDSEAHWEAVQDSTAWVALPQQLVEWIQA